MMLLNDLAKKMPTTEMTAILIDVLNPEDNEIKERQNVAEMVNVTDRSVAVTPLAPTTTAYINHMYYQTYFVSPEAGVASLLPCYWSYAECFKRHHNRATYQAFIDQYASSTFQQSNAKLIGLIDNLAE